MTVPLIETRGLSHRFPGGKLGLDDVSFALRPGEFVILAGKNGSGKTLLVRHLLGLAEPTAGEVLFRGSRAAGNFRKVREAVGFVFQETDHQLVGQSVEEELRFGPENLNLPEEVIAARTETVKEYLGLGEASGTPPGRLSGGEKRRLAVGGILTTEPELLILDEPFANLDYPGVVGVLRMIVDLHRRGKGILLITHELEKALAHAERLVILEAGRIMEDGPAEETAAKAGSYGLHPLDFSRRSPGEYTWLR